MQDARLVDLEVRYTHLERLIEELSSQLFEQHKRVEALERRVEELEGGVGPEGQSGPEQPPHY